MPRSCERMLAVYLTALLVGGVFVGLSVISGLDKDADVDVDKELSFDKEFGDFDADADVDFDADADVDFDADADVDFDGDADADADVGGHDHDHDYEASVAEASHGGDEKETRRRKRLWLPFLSFRFWTFGATFFGLTGACLTWLGAPGEPLTGLVAGGAGLAIGTFTSWLVRTLRRQVDDSVRRDDFAGQVGELVLTLRPGALSKVKLLIHHREHELLAVSDHESEIPKGAKVVVLGIDDSGRAKVTPENELYLLEQQSEG